MKQFKENAAKQRSKIKDMKRDEQLKQNEVLDEDVATQPMKLTQENLQKADQASEKRPSQKPFAKGKKKEKPMWAMTEKELEDQKEKEIDDLLEFAYELDYEKYMEDFEVRQALAIIKDRV